MKIFYKPNYLFIFTAFLFFLMVYSGGCKKKDSPVKFPMGIFPDSLYNLSGLNSEYDDYNLNLYSVSGTHPVIFSSNRGSKGGQFDFVQGVISFDFDKETGNFVLSSDITSDIYYATIINKANTSLNDFGPYSYFSSSDGYEYMIYASETADNGLDLFYVKNLPRFGNNAPNVTGPFPITVINTSFNDSYVTFNFNGDSIYFCSDRDGNYDIYVLKRNAGIVTDLFFSGAPELAVKVDSINSSFDDMAPYIYMNIIVFASNRPGGLGGFDLYYSVYKNGKWSSPFNLGPSVNSSHNEFRPVIIYNKDFSNQAILFSSDRPGGSGRYDLYFTGFNLPVSRVIY